MPRDVMAVAEMAIAVAGGSGLVYEAVRQAFDGFQPSPAHNLLTSFNWRMIATTNYDCLIERAYNTCPKAVQTPVKFIKDDEPVEDQMQATAKPVAYLKLHGCLDHIFDRDVPLILSREQYASFASANIVLIGAPAEVENERSAIENDFGVKSVYSPAESNAAACEPASVRDRRR